MGYLSRGVWKENAALLAVLVIVVGGLLQAQPLGTGSISCRIALGSVVAVRHASGGQTCVAGVQRNTRTSGWSPY